jgi:hypothetical protein
MTHGRRRFDFDFIRMYDFDSIRTYADDCQCEILRMMTASQCERTIIKMYTPPILYLVLVAMM